MSFKKLNLNAEVLVYESEETLDKADFELLKAAKASADKAYAPYSEFYVGAAVLLDNGQIVTGNNQENAAYPSGLCAERVALFYASSQFPQCKIQALAITVKKNDNPVTSPVSPCGACRQVMAEYESKHGEPFKIIMAGQSGSVYICNSVSVLLPLVFNAKVLNQSL